MANFDPYHQWLAISPKDQPPTHYRLLGIDLFESNANVIANAADQRMTHVKTFQAGKNSALSQKLLNEISSAKICLLNPEKKAVYDQKLRQQSAPPASSPPPSAVAPPARGDLDFLNAPAITPRAIPAAKAKSKQSPDRKPIWLGLGLFGAVAVLVLAIVVAFNLGRSGKEVASSDAKPLPTTATPTEKKSTTPKPKDRSTEPVKPPKERAKPKPPEEPPVDPVKPKLADPTKPKDTSEEPTPQIPPSTKEADPKQEVPEKPPQETPKEPVSTEVPVPNPASEPEKPPKEKLPIPAKAEQEKALAMIRETYKEDYRATDQAAFAKKLMQNADESKDDSVARFVLLREAKDAAVKGNDGTLAFEVLDVLAEEYDVKVSQVKADILEAAVKKARLPGTRRAIAEAALEVISQAIREDNFAVARQLGKQASLSARSSKDLELIQSVVAKNKEVEAAAKAYADIEEATETLKEKPDDPDANLAVGKYWCCKGDWKKGLPMLVLGSDEKLKALAESDIKGATSPEEQVKLGDGWWSIDQESKNEWRGALLIHAGTWYQQAQPNLTTALVKSLVEKRLKEITALGRDIPTVSGERPPLAVAPFDEKMAKKHQSRWAKYLGEPVVQTNSIRMKLALIPPGMFIMGSPDSESGAAKNEKPQHRIRITKPYWLSVTEVTQEQYQRVMGSNPSEFKGPKNPVEKVSWDDAVEFCRKLSELPGEKAAKRWYALPTEAQWEYACRAGNPGRWFFSPRPGLLSAGEEEKLLGEYAWSGVNANAVFKTHPVGEKRSNAFGLYDMYGNVWEWCADWYDEGYYAKSPMDDPMCAIAGSIRVTRGGNYGEIGWRCRSANRRDCDFVPGARCPDLGFRVTRVQAE